MTLQVASINSGSNGNCYYVGNSHEAVLVDAGISCREIERRMTRMGLSMQRVKAVFISHEHSDHIKGVEVLSKKHRLPVYITQKTCRSGNLNINAELVNDFNSHQPITIGKLAVTAFSKHHDAADPYSFVISNNDLTVGVFTDLGHACENVISYFKKCNAAFLECNYDEAMLNTGHYPPHLKFRIKSSKGHLSNAQALELFTKHGHSKLSHLFLSHLSKDNNDPQLALDCFRPFASSTKILVASRYHESGVYEVSGQLNDAKDNTNPVVVAPSLKKIKKTAFMNPEQMSLF